MKVLIALFVFTFFSCEKDSKYKPVYDAIPCKGYEQTSKPYETIDTSPLTFQHFCFDFELFYPDKYVYWHPCARPNSDQEFCYLRRAAQGYELWKFNFCNGNAFKITDKVNYFPQWSIKDWIIFTGLDLQLWKVRSNGNGLVRLTNTGNYNNYAKWSPDGTKYIYLDASLNKLRISNEDGSLYKIISTPMPVYEWYSDHEILFTDGTTNPLVINKLDINASEKVTEVHRLTSPAGINIYSYSSYLNYAYLKTQTESYRLNLKTKELLKLATKEYERFFTGANTFMPHKIILQRILNDTVHYCGIDYRSHITISDEDGSNERRVLIPE